MTQGLSMSCCYFILFWFSIDKMSTQGQQTEKQYDPNDQTLKFVKGKDEITGDDDPNTLRAEMSCGHAVDPNSLTAWCRSLLDRGQYKFFCPALKNGTTSKCEEEWPYQEVRKLAVLSCEEQLYFEETVAQLAAAEYCEYKSCPGCKTFVERCDLTNLSVRCSICTTERGRVYDFCWQCLNTWKGQAPRSDRCDNEGCINQELEILKYCLLMNLPETKVKQCPSTRACPTCGKLIEHSQVGCKYMNCTRCHVEFCFACLELKIECQKSRPASWFDVCAKGIAPRQTSIPTWNRHG
uniref:Si:ch211-212k18.15 n=1 Tax=Callorhinchus milii TaxID=7868 RepID=A0A4W3JM44_CALMI